MGICGNQYVPFLTKDFYHTFLKSKIIGREKFIQKKSLSTQLKFCIKLKVRQSQNDVFKLTFLPKNERMNSTLLLCDLFLFVFWKKLKTPKRHFEIIWPLVGKKLECVTAEDEMTLFIGVFYESGAWNVSCFPCYLFTTTVEGWNSQPWNSCHKNPVNLI